MNAPTTHAEQLATMSKLGHEYGARLLANDILRWAVANRDALPRGAVDSLLAIIGKHVEL